MADRRRSRSTGRRRAAGIVLLLAVVPACSTASYVGDDGAVSTTRPTESTGAAPSSVTLPPGAMPEVPFTEREKGCLAAVESLDPPERTQLPNDFLVRVANGDVAPLPLPGHDEAELTGRTAVDTVDDYFRSAPAVIAPEERRAAMEAAGLQGSVDIDLAYGDQTYGVQVITFASEPGARDYFALHVRRICRDAVDLVALDAPVGAVSYLRATNSGFVPRAVALVGRTEVAVSLCRCVDVDDPQGVAAAWLADVVEGLVEGAPAT